MRKIKFRAWNEIDKIMYPGMSMGSIGTQCSPRWFEMELMQFTGLLDKNGKEIYEGDVLEGGDTRYSVTWNENRAGFLLTGKPRGFSHYQTMVYASQVAKTEIIGNTYENPELLEGK